MTFYLVFISVYLLLSIYYLVSLQALLKTIKIHNQKLKPNSVWLMLIPVFNIFWNFILADKISKSIELEIHDLGHEFNRQTLYTFGILNAFFFILFLLSDLLQEGHSILKIAAFIIWGMYWHKLIEYKKAIKNIQQANS